MWQPFCECLVSSQRQPFYESKVWSGNFQWCLPAATLTPPIDWKLCQESAITYKSMFVLALIYSFVSQWGRPLHKLTLEIIRKMLSSLQAIHNCFVLSGKSEGNGRMHITLCDFIVPWDSLSATQKKSLNQRYQMGCECKVNPNLFTYLFDFYNCPCQQTILGWLAIFLKNEHMSEFILSQTFQELQALQD